MNASVSPPSIRRALWRSGLAGLRAGHEIGCAAREAVEAVVAALRERRGVVRTLCMATEESARCGIRIVREFEARSVAAWRVVPLVRRPATGSIAVATRIAVAILSVVVAAMTACDIALNTGRTERLD